MTRRQFNHNITAFILAAGRGERLRPITERIPKPLLPILGKPVLESILEKIAALSIRPIGINLHHLKDVLADWIEKSRYERDIILFPEDPILGTGGALKHAEWLLKQRPFLVHNADVLSDIDLKRLIDCHIASNRIATLAVHDCPRYNRLILDEGGSLIAMTDSRSTGDNHPRIVAGIHRLPGNEREKISTHDQNDRTSDIQYASDTHPSTEKIRAFTGIAVYQPEFLEFLPEGNSSVVDAWFRARSAGCTIGTHDVTGTYWTDIGTPSSYARAVTRALRTQGDAVFVHPTARGCDGAELDGYVVIEQSSVVPHGTSLRNCICLPGTDIGKMMPERSYDACFLVRFWGSPESVSSQKTFENSIVGPNCVVSLEETNFYETDIEGRIVIGTGGSDRMYYRISRDTNTFVLMQSPESDPDFERHIEYTRFLRKYGIPVPELLDIDSARHRAHFEDVHGVSLYDWLRCPRTPSAIEAVYRKILDVAIALHAAATEHVEECPLLKERVFDYAHLRWESSYFLEWFVRTVRNIEMKDLASLERDLHALAELVDAFPKTIVHRDLQAQNIVISRGGVPRILDYQGARMGPPAYDLASLLWDPYVRLDDRVRTKLLSYYLERTPSDATFTRQFHATVLPCRLQRHMQALGAYGFLSRNKGKVYFERHIPEAVRLLKGDIREAGNAYPALSSLVSSL